MFPGSINGYKKYQDYIAQSRNAHVLHAIPLQRISVAPLHLRHPYSVTSPQRIQWLQWMMMTMQTSRAILRFSYMGTVNDWIRITIEWEVGRIITMLKLNKIPVELSMQRWNNLATMITDPFAFQYWWNMSQKSDLVKIQGRLICNTWRPYYSLLLRAPARLHHDHNSRLIIN